MPDSSPRSPSRLVTLALLYVSQAIPLGFFIVAMPAILRSEGSGLEAVGLLGALATPWLLKFAWAPLIDRHGSRHGHYRSWLIPLQIGCVASVAGIATLELDRHLGILLGLGAVFMLLSATQDIATDGLAVKLLATGERGLGNGIQVGGYYLGQILGGGLALVLYSRFGWTAAVGVLAALLALPLPFVLLLAEPDEEPSTRRARRAVGLGTLRRFVGRAGIAPWLVLVLLWRAGETSAQWMFNPMLVDRGLDLDQIGILLGVVGSLASLAGAMIGGWLTDARSRRTALLACGALLGLALFGYLVPALGLAGMPGIVGAVLGVAAAGGMATAALYTMMMDHCRPDSSATDFTVQQSLAALGPLVASGASGFSAAALGYPGHFAAAGILQLLVVGLAAIALQNAEAAAPAVVERA